VAREALENVVLAPRCKQLAVGRLETEKAQNLPTLVYVEPAQIPIEGIFPARTLSQVKPRTRQSPQLTQPSDGTVTRSAKTAHVMLANFSEETLTVPKHTVLGIAQQVSEDLIDKTNAESESDTNKPLKRQKNEALYKKLLPGKLDFVVEHRAGKKMTHVNALSRHVGAIVQGGTLEKEDVLREQTKDAFRLKQNPGTYASGKGVLLGRRWCFI